jgi:apolipoprotein N-acyltransferase
MAAVYYMAFAAVYARLAGGLDARWVPLATAATWVAAEFGRARLLSALDFLVSNPWGLLGYSQVGYDGVVQIASVTGVYGVSFAIVAVDAALVELGFAAARNHTATGRAAQGAALAALPLTAILLYGHWTLRRAPPAEPRPGAVSATIVQGNVGLDRRWNAEFYGRNLEVYLRATRDALASHPGGIVFWPESALTFFLELEPDYQRAIARVLSAGDAELIAGGPRREGAGDQLSHYNAVFLIDPAGRTQGRYDKQQLVPFSEYAPLADISLLRRSFGQVSTFLHGGPTAPLPTRAGQAGILVCNEAMLPELAAARVREGAAYLVNPSNDTWIPSRRFADHLFDIVRLRAVEQRRFLVRASTSGPSAIVDPWGRVQVRSDPFSQAVVSGWIRPAQERSLYSRLGDAFACLCTGSVVLALVAARGSREAATR